jgi:hypothetical protein
MVYQCAFSDMGLGYIGTVYACNRLTTVELGDGKQIADISGDHVQGRDNANVKGFFSQTSTHSTYFPRNLGEFFPNLISLHFGQSNFTSISSNDLRNLPTLEVFIMYHSKLLSIDGDLFQNTPNLRVVGIAYNPLLQHVGFNLLTDLSRLQIGNFYENGCINMYAGTSDQIQELKRVLPIQCTPLPCESTTTSTTAPDFCSAGCMDEIKENEKEIQLLRVEISRQSGEIDELKRQMRELMASPCSCI